MDQSSGRPSRRNGRSPDDDAPPEYRPEQEEVMRVVYQSNQDGELVGVGSALLLPNQQPEDLEISNENQLEETDADLMASGCLRNVSTLPSVAEESTSNGGSSLIRPGSSFGPTESPGIGAPDESTSRSVSRINDQEDFAAEQSWEVGQQEFSFGSKSDHSAEQTEQAPIYSTINKKRYNTDTGVNSHLADQTVDSEELESRSGSYPLHTHSQTSTETATADQQTVCLMNQQTSELAYSTGLESEVSTLRADQYLDLHKLDEIPLAPEPLSETYDLTPKSDHHEQEEDRSAKDLASDEDIACILSRQQPGAAESGSFRNNFKKRLGISFSSNEKDLEAHRLKLSQTHDNYSAEISETNELEVPGKFKRTHSVSFNVNSSRSGRLSVDIRNLPSYLTVKRASIVDVARGAVSSLIHSFGSNSSSIGVGGSGNNSHRRDSSPDEEPIFEEPIAPTLSLGQRVAMVKDNGTEFGTVGWIGQLPGVEDDWVVGVIFDNMIGNCDGAYNGIRYFYSRENYAMFVPLLSLTKTDNYIGRPETGTMLSRMSVSLKPGQLISIQPSSLRLQHCFLNAPHQRVGHDVRAVSNRLHCQCHNCGPCAHLTKQGRSNVLPPIAAHHAPNKKNSLAHAAVELLAHHHHHYHDEEAHEPEDYQFGDNAAHACNFVRYSCCQQSGAPGHDFSADCGLVRPELLDNLIHAPRAPHRRSRPRRRAQRKPAGDKLADVGLGQAGLVSGNSEMQNPLVCAPNEQAQAALAEKDEDNDDQSSYTSFSSCSSSRLRPSEAGRDHSFARSQELRVDQYQYNSSSSYQEAAKLYSTFDSHMSIREQQRFISQRDSSALIRSNITSGDYYFTTRPAPSLTSRVRRCFACLFTRHNPGEHGRHSSSKAERSRRKRGRKQRRKLSARNRMLEYRRRQSTFVPSTLAKPQEDFASHGIVLPENEHSSSDYSSFSRSYSNSSGGFSSPSDGPEHDAHYPSGAHVPATIAFESFRNSGTLVDSAEHGYFQSQEEPLKSNLDSVASKPSYDFSDSYGSYKKDGFSRDSNLTDLGFFDSMNGNSSFETLKQIVDQGVNEQEALPAGASLERDLATLSPVRSQSQADEHSDQTALLDISSPTVSIEASARSGDSNLGQDVAMAAGGADAAGTAGPDPYQLSEDDMCQVLERLDLERIHEES